MFKACVWVLIKIIRLMRRLANETGEKGKPCVTNFAADDKNPLWGLALEIVAVFLFVDVLLRDCNCSSLFSSPETLQ